MSSPAAASGTSGEELVRAFRHSTIGLPFLSSVSVLTILEDTLAQPPVAGTHGLMLAMGPGFCLELVLLEAAA